MTRAWKVGAFAGLAVLAYAAMSGLLMFLAGSLWAPLAVVAFFVMFGGSVGLGVWALDQFLEPGDDESRSSPARRVR